MAQPGEGADLDITMTLEEEEMEISMDEIMAVQGVDNHLLSHETLEDEVLEELGHEHDEAEEGDASQGL